MFKRLTVSRGLGAFAVLWFMFAAWSAVMTVHAALRYESVSATLVESQSGRCSKYVGEGGSRREVTWECFSPLVSYEVAGKQHSVVLSFRTREGRFLPDERFDVWVNPENPLEPMEAGVRGWVKPLALLVAGLIVLLFAHLAR
ncbi:hypothetical protein P2318_24275 [Myxococcaceae bacterium GXIMD 01537]